MEIPRIIIAALRGGSGKTILSIGIIAALKKLGKSIAPFKKGPDYIDAGWLALAAGFRCIDADQPQTSPVCQPEGVTVKDVHHPDLLTIARDRAIRAAGSSGCCQQVAEKKRAPGRGAPLLRKPAWLDGLWLALAVAASELVNSAAGVDDFLFAGIEGMAL